MKNDTPRTDAVLNTFDGKASKLAADLATHAEELERELTAVTKERDEARGQRDKAIAMLWRLNFAVTDCYNAAFDYSNPPREQDVLPIINEVYEFLTT